MKYDAIIVGAGWFGATFAREASDRGKRVLVLEKQNEVGGHAQTKEVDGIQVHQFGAHIFHTSDKQIWDYVSRFAEFNHYLHRVKVRYGDRLFSFPINLITLQQLWGVTNTQEAEARLKMERLAIENPHNLEEWALSNVGEEIYLTFFRGYTLKQWGRDPKELPASIIRRLPIRLTRDDSYYDDTYQGIPIGGYTTLIRNMLSGIEVRLGVDYLENKSKWDSLAPIKVFTGEIDRFFDYQLGHLEYRSLRFDHERLPIRDFQGNSVVNYTSEDVPFTRIIEHKHFESGRQDYTIITREFPDSWQPGKTPYYPVNDDMNNRLYLQYQELAKTRPDVRFGGRLGGFRYYDMHQVIGESLALAGQLL